MELKKNNNLGDMLSAKVIQAIHVMLMLDKNTRFADGKKRCVDTDGFGAQGTFHKSILRHVLRQLTKGGYIANQLSHGYTLLRNPQTVTVYELILFFHGSICIGELCDHREMIGSCYYPKDEQIKIQTFEQKLENKWIKALQCPIDQFAITKSDGIS